jgi:hypothetical protein
MLRFKTALFLSFICLQCSAFAAEEKMAWDIWQKMAGQPEDLSEVITDCEAFMNGRQTDQIAPVVVGILSWCYFKTERMPEGAKLLMSIERRRSTPISKAGSDVARTWLGRIDIKLVKAVLMVYYRKYQKFPEKLQEAIDFALETKNIRAPNKDRWGKPWEYELVGFKMLTKVPKNQKYSLGSKILGKYTDFEKALELPYAEKIDIVPVRMGSSTRGSESVYFKQADVENAQPVLMKIGDRRMGVTFAFIGKNIIALTDGNHWKLVPRPRR